MQASIHQSSAWDQACLTQPWWDFMKTMRLHNRGQSHKLWSCFLLGLRRFGLLQPALWLGGRTRAIASTQRCPGVSYTHAWPMPLSIRLGLFWSNFWEKPKPPKGKTSYLGSHVSKKKPAFSALEMPCGTSDKCFAWRKCLFQWPGSWKLLVTSQLRQFSVFLWWKMRHLENCGVDGVGSNMVSSLSGLCLSVFGGFFLMIMPTRICHYYSQSHRHPQHHHDHHHQHRYHQHQFWFSSTINGHQKSTANHQPPCLQRSLSAKVIQRPSETSMRKTCAHGAIPVTDHRSE